MPIPPDTRVAGDFGHVEDHNDISDELTTIVAAVTAETSRAETAEGAALQKASNLSDLASAGTARTNLGLTGAATAPLPLAVSNGGTGAATLTGLVKGNGTSAFTAATASTDYAPATSGSAILKGNGSGGFSSAVSGTDYAPVASPALTGSPTAPTQTTGDSSTKIATDAFVATAVGNSAAYFGAPTPASCGYAGWLCDPMGGCYLGAPTSSSWTSGTITLLQANVIPGVSVNGYITVMWTPNASLANAYFSVWTVSGGVATLVGSTANEAALAGTHVQRLAVGGFTSTPASGIMYVSYMNGTGAVAGGPWSPAGTAWYQGGSGAYLPPGSAYRLVRGGSGLTSPPSSVTLSGYSTGYQPFWFALD